MLKYYFSVVLLFVLSGKAFAIYDVNDNCKKAWMLIMDLQVDKAKGMLSEEIRHNPENYYAYYLDQTCDVFRLIINSGDKDYKAFLENFEKKRKIMDGKDESSPYYLSCYSEMELQVAVFSVMHGSQWMGVKKGYAAYRNLYKNLGKYPNFKPNQKLDGFFNVAIANMPPFLKWVISFFGVKVDIKYGFRTLNEYYLSQKNTPGLNAEAALYLILAAKINKTPEMLYDFTKTLDPSVANTYIQKYFRANIAYWTGRNEEALKIMQEMNPDKTDIRNVIYCYMTGKILMRKMDQKAGQYISKYLGHLEKKEYLKEMNYNLALLKLVEGDKKGYENYCTIVRSQGMDMNERDREALYDAKLDYLPDVNLVRARMYLAGGYLDLCQASLGAFDPARSDKTGNKLEYHFLKGRFEDIRGNRSSAMEEYKKVIQEGSNENYYFSTEACFRLGMIYQKLGKKDLARDYYQKSLKLYHSDYYEYIQDMATKALVSL